MWGGLGSRSGAVGTAGSSSALAPNTGGGSTSTTSSSSLLGEDGAVALVVRRRLDGVVVPLVEEALGEARRRLPVVGRVGLVVLAVVGCVGVVVLVAAVEEERQWRQVLLEPEESSPSPHHACKWPSQRVQR